MQQPELAFKIQKLDHVIPLFKSLVVSHCFRKPEIQISTIIYFQGPVRSSPLVSSRFLFLHSAEAPLRSC